ncbi:hypothetical protein [Hymenobacter cavernae]|uniref:Uncharacterized protein n=1 Tax=Hymenobacter cavernae TaxID=2044852 RepID=A0ABQ1U860_9BACT|nr:hypothetical protein [Hymenobacter cavernae]GGF11126.1 hypothetical protein GCM10011383_22890 [Hymenobacter cavernae]
MLVNLEEEQFLLAYTMSNISERCYYAGWMQGLEYVLYQALHTGPRRYGHSEISVEDITALTLLSKRGQCWIYMDDKTEETAINLELWHRKYTVDVASNPLLLQG